MRIVHINVTAAFSTGRIAVELCRQAMREGHRALLCYARGSCPSDVPGYRIGSTAQTVGYTLLSRLTDRQGFFGRRETEKLVAQLKKFKPDIVHLHNLHGSYLHLPTLFAYLKENDLPTVWTLHDCWAFTGHCSYFTMVKCEQWKSHCSYCSQLRRYPACFAMSSVSKNFERKRKAFTGVKNMTLITPSKWLADLTRQSFLKEYPVEVHYNTIDTSIFKPTPSDFRERYGLQDKTTVLGVANVWEDRKGLFDFYKLAQMLDDRYAIVLVGLSEKQIKDLPKNIKGIQRTNSLQELAAIYTAADVLVNSSVEETFGMTPVEAQACGTPSIVYEDTACEEVALQNGNTVVPQDVNALYEAITGYKFNGGITNNTCRCTIICIPRTNSPQELAAIYTAADVFANPTYEDNYPTVNLEAQACGTRVVTYDTGGSRETIKVGIK